MVSIPVLKIEADGGILLVSRNAKQEVCPISKMGFVKNINSDVIKIDHKPKFKSVIETGGDLDIEVLRESTMFKIYSIVRFQSDSDPIPGKFVEDSLENNDKGKSYRPIFDMRLTNFNCKTTTDGEQLWKLEFEEV